MPVHVYVYMFLNWCPYTILTVLWQAFKITFVTRTLTSAMAGGQYVSFDRCLEKLDVQKDFVLY